MAFPIILINSATGSDTAASGAGPATAITGSAAATDATGLIVTLDGSPDLSGVATDGSHVLFLDDTTSNVRNFSSISAVDNTAKTVTITTGEAFAASVSGLSWAIGGVRASIWGVISRRLWTTVSNSAGDAMPGWTARMQSGHAESLIQVIPRRPGDTVNGFITIEGEFGAAVRPVLTCSTAAFAGAMSYVRVANLDVKKSGSIGGTGMNSITRGIVENVRVLNNGGVWFATGFTVTTGQTCRNNYVEAATVGISLNGGIGSCERNIITGCTSHGISCSLTTAMPSLENNIIYGCGGNGINLANTTDSAVGAPFFATKNTIHGNTGDGIAFSSSSTQSSMFQRCRIENNQITQNGGYGINYSDGSVTDLSLFAARTEVRNNNFGTGGTANTSGDCNLTLTLTGADNLAVDPQYTDAASGDFRIGTNTSGLGLQLTAIGSAIVAGNRSYIDIGALQRQEAGGSSLPLIGGKGLIY